MRNENCWTLSHFAELFPLSRITIIINVVRNLIVFTVEKPSLQCCAATKTSFGGIFFVCEERRSRRCTLQKHMRVGSNLTGQSPDWVLLTSRVSCETYSETAHHVDGRSTGELAASVLRFLVVFFLVVNVPCLLQQMDTSRLVFLIVVVTSPLVSAGKIKSQPLWICLSGCDDVGRAEV